MSNFTSIAASLWPALFVISLLPVVLMTLSQSGGEKQAGTFAIVACLVLTAVLYVVPPISELVRWGLSLIGLAAPLALGVISIQYLVEETSEPF